MNLRWAATTVLLATLTPALAFDDKQFCAAVRQLALAAEKDVGLWVDRQTRSAGMKATCERRTVEFTRFTYLSSSSMTAEWKASRGAEWSKSQCSSDVWSDAIGNGWAIILEIASADGGKATFKAQCR